MRPPMRHVLAALTLLPLAACGAANGPPLVSAQFPPGTGMVNVNSPAQSENSLPPDAANVANVPGGFQPSYGSLILRLSKL